MSGPENGYKTEETKRRDQPDPEQDEFEKRVEDFAAKPGDADQSRRQLVDDALKTRPEEVREVGSSQPDAVGRAFIRDSCAKELADVHVHLAAGSDMMFQLNQDAQLGKLKPGTKQYEELFGAACNKYFDAIKVAAEQRSEIRNGQTVESQLVVQAKQESERLGIEIGFLNQLIDSGTEPNQQQREALGMRPNESASDAVRRLVEEQTKVDDYVRAEGDSQAAYGLALVLSSAWLSPESKQAQLEEAEEVFRSALRGDPRLAGDPRFSDRFVNNMSFSESSGAQAAATTSGEQFVSTQTGEGGEKAAAVPEQPTETAEQTGARLVQDAGKNFILEGPIKVPTGDVAVGSAGYKDPVDLLEKVKAGLHTPITEDDRKNMLAAIKASDDIDRVALYKEKEAAREVMAAWFEDPQTGPDLKSLVADRAENEAITKRATELMTMLVNGYTDGNGAKVPGLRDGGSDAVPALRKLQGAQSSQELKDLLESKDPATKTLLDDFRKLDGADKFINYLSQYHVADAAVTQIDKVMNDHFKPFADARKTFMQDSALYGLPKNARIAFFAALASDPENLKVKENADLAKQLAKEAVHIDQSLLKDEMFMTAAEQLGIKQDELVRPDYADRAYGLPDPKDRSPATAVERALELYGAVRPDQPINDKVKQAFQNALEDSNFTDEQAAALQSRLDNELGQLVPREKLERAKQLSEDLKSKVEKLSPDAQEAVSMVLRMQDQLDGLIKSGQQPELARVEKAALDQALAAAASGDPAKQATVVDLLKKGGLEGEEEPQLLARALQDPNLKPYLDALSAKRQYLAADPELKAVLQRYGAAMREIEDMKHASNEILALYGAAQSKAGDHAEARKFLEEAGKDPTVLDVPMIRAAYAKEVGGVKPSADKAASDADAGKVTDSNLLPGMNPKLGPVKNALAAIAIGQKLLEYVSRDGKDLMTKTLELKVGDHTQKILAGAAFAQIMDACAKCTPEELDKYKAELDKDLHSESMISVELPGGVKKVRAGAWDDKNNPEFEAQIGMMGVASGREKQAFKLIPPAMQPEVEALAGVLDSKEAKPAEVEAAKARLAVLATENSAVQQFKETLDEANAASIQFQRWLASDPVRIKKYMHMTQSALVEKLKSAEAMSMAIYSAAVAQTGDEDSFDYADRKISRTLKDNPELYIRFPEVISMARLAGIPGYADLAKAKSLLAGEGSAVEKLERSQKFFEKAIEVSHNINVSNWMKDCSEQSKTVEGLEADLKPLENGSDPEALEQKLRQFAIESSKLGIMGQICETPMAIHYAYAEVINKAAMEKFDLAAKESDLEKKAKLEAEGKQYNKQAADVLRALGKFDGLHGSDPLIVGAIDQCEKNKPMDERKAESIGALIQIQSELRNATISPLKSAAAPFLMLNLGGETLSGAATLMKKVPYLGSLPGYLLDAIGGGVTPAEHMLNEGQEGRPTALSMSVRAIEKGDKETLERGSEDLNQMLKNKASSGLLTIASGPLAVKLVEKAAPKFLIEAAERSPNLAVKAGATLTLAALGLSATYGIRAGGDILSNNLFGTDRLSSTELASQSVASYFVALATKGLNAGKVRMEASSAPLATEAIAAADATMAGRVTTMKLKGGELTTSPGFLEAMANLPNAARQKAMEGLKPGMSYGEQWGVFVKAQGEVRGKMLHMAVDPRRHLMPRNYEAIGQVMGQDPGRRFNSLFKWSNYVKGIKGEIPNRDAAGRLAMTEDGLLNTKWADMWVRKQVHGLVPGMVEGGVAMSLLAAGEFNPMIEKKDPVTGKGTGEFPTVAETVDNMWKQGLWGAGGTAVFSRLVAPVANMTFVQPAKLMYNIPKWLGNREALSASKTLAESAVVPTGQNAVSRFFSASGSDAGRYAAMRFLAGGSLGFTEEGIRHAPWFEKDSKTHEHYTLRDTATHAFGGFLIGGTALSGAPFVGKGLNWAWEKGVNPYLVQNVKYGVNASRAYIGNAAFSKAGPLSGEAAGRAGVGLVGGFGVGFLDGFLSKDEVTGKRFDLDKGLNRGAQFGTYSAIGAYGLPYLNRFIAQPVDKYLIQRGGKYIANTGETSLYRQFVAETKMYMNPSLVGYADAAGAGYAKVKLDSLRANAVKNADARRLKREQADADEAKRLEEKRASGLAPVEKAPKGPTVGDLLKKERS